LGTAAAVAMTEDVTVEVEVMTLLFSLLSMLVLLLLLLLSSFRWGLRVGDGDEVMSSLTFLSSSEGGGDASSLNLIDFFDLTFDVENDLRRFVFARDNIVGDGSLFGFAIVVSILGDHEDDDASNDGLLFIPLSENDDDCRIL